MAKSAIDSLASGKTPKRRRSPHDASLLFCCMDVLQIDHNKLAQDEPLLYRELQGVCTLCPNKRDCAFDLSKEFDGMRWDEWWLYCPNSAMLTTIGALQKCRHPPHYQGERFQSSSASQGVTTDWTINRHGAHRAIAQPNDNRVTDAYFTKLR
jgi:hypothetical protein